MTQIKFYVDFDDILAETANKICEISKDLFGTTATFEQIIDFDLQKSLNITQEQYEKLMHIMHEDCHLESYAPIAGACAAINFFSSQGIIVDVVTGRPPDTLNASTAWLKKYGFDYNQILFVDKYGRFSENESKQTVLTLEDVQKSDYSLIIDDAPIMLEFVAKNMKTPIAVLERPWNQLWLTNRIQTSDRPIFSADTWAKLQQMITTLFELY
ncbi:MAG: hypothetical protein PF692_06365 [Kiritimatiellae bacterium]|jgi:uncharacterized HAD superfamily protein|nr:hypothetical protein [Kiritimatiellia bacterium]